MICKYFQVIIQCFENICLVSEENGGTGRRRDDRGFDSRL